jgi:hypothetical protein
MKNKKIKKAKGTMQRGLNKSHLYFLLLLKAKTTPNPNKMYKPKQQIL